MKKKVSFCDEFKIELHSNPSEYLRKRAEGRNNAKYTAKSLKFDTGKVKMRGGIKKKKID